MSQTFIEQKTQMALKYMKILNLINHKNMQIKISVVSNFTSTRLTKIWII